MAHCAHYQICGREAEANDGESLCILHSKDPNKDKAAFDRALAEHREGEGDKFRFFVFPGDVNFSELTFEGDTDFRGATFSGKADFRGATFRGDAGFGGATFSGHADFIRATFSGDADFRGAKFGEHVGFWEATFSGGANFEDAAFSDNAVFVRVSFGADAGFSEATFSGDTYFHETTFRGKADFIRATCSHSAGFSGATFLGHATFSAAAFGGDCHFYGATFSSDARFDGGTFRCKADFERTTFSGYASFFARMFSGRTIFAGAKFGRHAEFDSAYFTGKSEFDSATFNDDAVFRSTRFAGKTTFQWTRFKARALFLDVKANEEADKTQISPGPEVDFTNVTIDEPDQITFRNSDLRKWRFLGTDVRKAEFTGVTWPKHRGRLVVYDEIASIPMDQVRDFAGIERLYRELKQNYEDRRDSDRAGDFHYGEKEMRRLNPDTPRGIRWLLLLYRIFSGYGEKYLRPLCWALGLLVVGTLIHYVYVLSPTSGGPDLVWMDFAEWGRAAILTVRPMFLLRPADGVPTGILAAGLNTALSLFGPLFLGLLALAIRQRLRR
ncbi:MAG: pentapeptide repeat-containing protein [Thermodesulfobacteriota bacterium]